MVVHVQTKREIEALLVASGVRPRKRFGQHFLIDGNLMRRLLEAASPENQDLVLEVGGGTGGLTDLLLAQAGHVVCVEIDRTLYSILAERFAGHAALTLIHGDVLASKHRLAQEVVSVLNARSEGSRPTVMLVANLPYQVATPLLMDLLLDFPQVRRLCFTVQAEVGERILSPSGRKSYGPLSIFCQLLCECRLVARIPPEAFWPRPAVDSVLLRLDVKHPAPFADHLELHRYTALVRGAFAHRRKTLRQSMSGVLSDAQRKLVWEQVDSTRRPESFSVEEWIRIFSLSEEASGDARFA